MKKLKARTTLSEKNSKKSKWYEKYIDRLDRSHYDTTRNYQGVSDFQRMRVNYDLFNNILNLSDFEYVCKPYGANVGELPADMVNRDISSGKIKAMLGMEKKRPFAWTVVATDQYATTRKEQEETSRLKEYIHSEIVKPIRQKLEMEKLQSQEGRKPTPDEMQRIQQQIEEELKTQTPEEVKKYMLREHQDPAEIMSEQLLKYLIQKLDIDDKFNIAFKHGMLSALEIMYVGILNGEPQVWNINSMQFNCDKSGDTSNVEDKEWATCEYLMSPSSVIQFFGKELKDSDIDCVWEQWESMNGLSHDGETSDEDLFSIDERTQDYEDRNSIRVLHGVWKALRKIGFLTYEDELGEIQEILVDENYEFNEDFGDIKIEWEWIPEVYETWKIKTPNPIYVYKRPVPGQFKDLDNLYNCKLPYYGVIYDNMNAAPTSLMDRLKIYQYYYNIVLYRLELLLASNKGKKVLMNVGSIPSSSGIDVEKWQYFFEATPFMYFDPTEEGSTYQDANTVAKVVDLSVATDIQQYMEIAEYLRKQMGISVGITDQVEGQISPNEAVGNSRQNLVQSSHVLEIYFSLHGTLKKNVLTALLETAKIAYADSKPRKLSYFMDDMTIKMFDLDIGLLDNSTLGLFVQNSTEAEEIKKTLRQLTHAAMQNQMVQLSDVLTVLRQESITEAEETLKLSEQNREEAQEAAQQRELEAKEESEEKAREFRREEHEMEKEIVVLKEEERRKTVVAQAALTGLSFNPELDQDNDGQPDFLEIAKHGVDAEVKREKAKLDRDKFEHQKDVDRANIANKTKELAIKQAQNQQKSVKP